jgi:uncharacterized NAD(P)/FAD-binding protein YdhS
MNRHRKVAVVGSGPRGLAVVERLGMGLDKMPEHPPVQVLLVDDHEPGAGRIWSTRQGPGYLMNTLASQVTLFSGPPDSGPIRPGHGPSLLEWMSAHANPEYARAGADTYAARHTYGEYMREVLDALIAAFPRPHRLRAHLARVQDVVRRGARYELIVEEGNRAILVDAVVLATGHATARLTGEEAEWKRFGEASGRCWFQPGDAAADQRLERVKPRDVVGVIGLGLGFHDILAELTTGRGGRFKSQGGRLIYHPSGNEPAKIFAGSRSGLPIPARGVNHKPIGYSFAPTFFKRTAIEAARPDTTSPAGRSLAFRKTLYPLIIAELEHKYYGTLARRLYGDSLSAAFSDDHSKVRDAIAPMPEELLRRFGLDHAPRLDLQALARPFDHIEYTDPQTFRRDLIRHLEFDLAEALIGNVDSPLKAALDVLRDVRDVLRSAVEFDGLTVTSFETEFKQEFAPLCSLLAAGPPAIRGKQLLAIEAAGLLGIIGPGLKIRCDAERDCFRMNSPRVPGHDESVNVLIDSRVPVPSLSESRNTLLQAMRRRGLIRPYVRLGEEEVSTDGGIDVVPLTFEVIGRDGAINPRIYAIGLPTESPRWFTQVGSATPGVVSRFTLDAMAVAQGVLRAVCGPAIEATCAMKEAG